MGNLLLYRFNNILHHQVEPSRIQHQHSGDTTGRCVVHHTLVGAYRTHSAVLP